jgi:aminoglycoside N3'-acetyltransferase
MPAYPLDQSALGYLALDILFDPRQTPSRMGKITEVFRNWPGAERSIHPTHSVVAIGSGAKKLVNRHFLSESPFTENTPFRRLLARDALILGLGVDVGPMTFYHVFEDIVDFPIPAYYPVPQFARILVEGSEQVVRTKVHDPKIARFRIDHDVQIKNVVSGKLLEMGILKYGKVGHGPSYSVRARQLMKGLERMLDAGITIYNTEQMGREGFPIPAALSAKL